MSPRHAIRDPRPTQRRTRAIAIAVGGALALAALVTGIVILQQPDAASNDAAASQAPAAASTTPDPSPSASVGPPPSASPSASPAEVGTQDATLGAQAAAQVDPPVAVRLPELGLDLPIVQVGVSADGQMEVPELVTEAGWYEHGPAPGAAEGSAVLAAHVDSDRGPAPMAVLLDVQPGTIVEVETASGALLRYRIETVEQLGKEQVPYDELFARDGAHVLRLVTCAGEWDAEAGAYEDNVVATAVLER